MYGYQGKVIAENDAGRWQIVYRSRRRADADHRDAL
jgi:hypothetical protein